MPTPLPRASWRIALLAAVLCSTALGHAASGYTVTAAQQSAVQPGMTFDQVQDLLGRPAHDVKYGAEAGHTWTYGVLGLYLTGEETVFDVHFTADGRVLSTSLRVERMR